MDRLPAASTSSSIMGRAQKIRERMMLEMASGETVATKDGFLHVCLQHEHNASGGSLVAYDGVRRRSCNREDIQSSWDWQRLDDYWDDWTDWHKFAGRSGNLR